MHAANKARTDLFHLTGGRSVTDILSICLKTLFFEPYAINSLLYSGYEIEKGSNKSVKTLNWCFCQNQNEIKERQLTSLKCFELDICIEQHKNQRQ